MSEMEDSSGVSVRKTVAVSPTIDHPRLVKQDASSIRVFLRLYDQYANEVIARAVQMSNDEAMSMETARPVDLKFCVDPEYLESAIALGFIPDALSYRQLTDATLRAFLEKKAEECKESITLNGLDIMVNKKLRMNMQDSSAVSRMQSLFVSYHTLLRQNGLLWVIETSQNVAVKHVLKAIRPYALQSRLSNDLEFSHNVLSSDFKGFMEHSIKLAEAFQLVDSGKSFQNKDSIVSGILKEKKKNEVDSSEEPLKVTQRQRKSRPLPLCPFKLCVPSGRRHYVNDCSWSNDEEKKVMREQLAARRPSSSTRSQTSQKSSKDIAGKTGRLSKSIRPTSDKRSDNCNVTLSDGISSIQTNGRCDDGSDDSLASPVIAEKAVAQGIGRIRKIPPVTLQVALRKGRNAEQFQFSRIWSIPRTVLHLSSGNLALVNTSFLVADDALACEDILIGQPILQHLQIDSRTLLEQNRAILDGSDCSAVGNPTVPRGGGAVSRLMIARINHVTNEDVEIAPVHTRPDQSRPRADYFEINKEQDPFPDPALLDPVDSDQQEDVSAAVRELLNRATESGLSEIYRDTLESILIKYTNIFRTGLSSGPPADLPPLRIKLHTNARSTRVKLRNYSQAQREFLNDFVRKLVEKGMAYPNPTAAWAAAPLLVPKPGPAKFRFTVDLRPVNSHTVKHQYPMPNLEHEISQLAGAKYFATFDLSNGYWQLPLHEDSQECQSFLTPDNVYSPTRVLHGTSNAVAHLQACLAEIIPPALKLSTITWLDDILCHGTTITSLMNTIECLFKIFQKHRLRLHPRKCNLFTTCITWCGRQISEKGIRFDPRRLDALLSMSPPTNGAHLQQFLCAMQWVKQCIPRYSEITHPLHLFIEKLYAKVTKRTKISVSRISLAALGWGEEQLKAFEVCKKALASQVTLTHRDSSKRLCVYTDASDVIWSGIITQVPKEELKLKHSSQNHEPLAFLSGRFNETQLRWSTLEKEAYAILASLERMHWLVATPDGFDLYTDHNNIIFIFDPLALKPDLAQSSVKKVLRWAVRMSMYNYVCMHIKGADNVWADLLGRWSATPTVRRIISIPPLVSTQDKEFEWPSDTEIAQLQSKHYASRPEGLFKHEGLWKNQAYAVWIPDESADLQLRICIVGHTTAAGHRGQSATEIAIRKHFFWKSMTTDVRTFVKACIHCISTLKGGKEPRPLGSALHGSEPNDLLQFDFLEMAPSDTGAKYILLLRDDFSSYSWLIPFAVANAENAADAIIEWASTFTVPKGLMSDGGSHFKNDTVKRVTKGLRTPHHFTLPYTPWSNGGVERLGKEVLRMFRAVLSELRLRHSEWPDLAPVIQSALNNSPSPRRRNMAPITIFSGLPPSSPVSTFKRSCTGKIVSVSDARTELERNLPSVQDRLAEIHPVVQMSLEEHRERARKAASRGVPACFTKGDYVLVAREEFSAGEKLCLRWRGPRRVVKALSDYVFQVEDLHNGSVEDVHASRIRFYSDSSLDREAIFPHVLSSETGMEVARLMNIEKHKNGLMIHVRWKGMPKEEDTLEPLQKVYEDVPKMVERLLSRSSIPKSLANEAKIALGLKKRGL